MQRPNLTSRVAESIFRRTAVLSKDGWATQDSFDQTTSTLNQLQATLAADAAAVEAARLNLGYTEIRAPFAGRLGRSLVHEGALINAAGTQLNTFVQLDPIYVTFNPSETDLDRLGNYRAKTIPAIKPFVPSSPDFVEKPCQGSGVARESVVRIMPAKLRIELRLLLRKRPVPISLTPRINAPH